MATDTFVHSTGLTDWVTATAYVVGDYRDNGGDDYRCIQAHTSGASTEPGTGGSWTSYWTNEVYTTVSLGCSNSSRSGADAACTIEEDATFTENVDITVAADGTYRFTLTVGDGFHHTGKWGSGAKIVGRIDCERSYITLDCLRISSTGNLIRTNFTAYTGGVVNRCLLMSTTGTSYGAMQWYGTGEVSACNIFQTGSTAGSVGLRVYGGSGTLYASHTSIRGFQGYGVQRTGGPTTVLKRVYSLGNGTDLSGTFDASSDRNITTDTTANTVNSSTLAWDTGIKAHAIWESPDEGDMRLTASRQWATDTRFGTTFDVHADAWTSNGTVSISSDDPPRGAKSVKADLATAGYYSRMKSLVFDDDYVMVMVKFSASADANDYQLTKIFGLQDSGTEALGFSLTMRTTGKWEIRVNAAYPTKTYGFTTDAFAVDTTYVFKLQTIVHTTTGSHKVWYKVFGAGSWTALMNETGLNTSAWTYDRVHIGNQSSLAGGVGSVYADTIMVSPTDFDEPDDTSSPYGNEFDAALSGYPSPPTWGAPSGPSYFPTTDITGAAWSDYHVGADDYSQGAGATTHALVGTITGTASPTGDLTRTVALTGTATGTASPTGALTRTVALSGTVTATASPTGDLTRTVTLTGTITGAATPTGVLTTGVVALAGTITATASPTGDLTVTRTLTGTVTGAATPTAALTLTSGLSGTVTGTASLTGDLTRTVTLTGTITGTATPTGALSGVVTASGPLSLPMSGLRTLLATTSEFQAWVGAGDVATAKESIYIAGADSVTRPFAVVSYGPMWRMDRYAGGARDWFVNRGSLRVLFEAAIGAGDVDDHEDAETAFLNDVGGIMTAALVLSGSGTHISLDSAELDFGPARSDEDEGEDYYQARFAVTWGQA